MKLKLSILVNLRRKDQLWFKRRRYGWGWTPVTWQGWAVVLGAMLLILVNSLLLNDRIITPTVAVLFTINTVAVIVVLVGISYLKGPRPKWRWGKGPKDTDDDI